ncbi:MAG: hypothetical protein LBR75_06510 [Prevotellaceae bacterium]|jgi:hypothetical protein|nr:hypothetical protein [Prevotellaceae bacterium]
MAKKDSKFSKFWAKIRFKYRLSIIDEDTLEEVRHFHLSRLSIFLLTASFAVVYFVVISLIILYTPLRVYLPAHTDEKTRTELINSAIRLDSLAAQVEIQAKYLEAVRGVIKGDIKMDSIVPIDSVVKLNTENILLEKAEKEEEFIQNYDTK